MQQQAHVVILESRRFPDITDQWYATSTAALTKQFISFSRVTVPHVNDLPLAYRLLTESAHNPKNKTMRIPDGYLMLGINYKGDTSLENHNSVWNCVLNLATQTGMPFASVLEYETEGEALGHAGLKYTSKINLAVQSLVSSLVLRQQLNSHTNKAA